MANTFSSLKRVRTTAKQTEVNRMRRTRMRTVIKWWIVRQSGALSKRTRQRDTRAESLTGYAKFLKAPKSGRDKANG
jgi:hypothetical protein